MSGSFDTVNRLLSVVMMALGAVLIWHAIQETGTELTISLALGVVLVVYGIVRYFAWSRYRRPPQ